MILCAKMNTYQPRNIVMAVVLSILMLCLLTACRNDVHPLTHSIRCAESLIWENPDSARTLLEQIPYKSLQVDEQMYWQLLHQHTAVRLGYSLSPDSIMRDVVSYFSLQDNEKHLAEALYVQGAEYYLLGQYNDAILCFKKAEDYISFLENSEPYIGMIYYMQGDVMDKGEGLYHAAKEYYAKALPYFQILPDKRRLACCYRDIARMLDYMRDSSCVCYYDTALYIARTARDNILYMDILIQKESFGQPFDSLKVYNLCKSYVDSTQSLNYAPYVIEYLIEYDSLLKASNYLNLYASDSTAPYWREERYHYLHSWFSAQSGDTENAYKELREVYLNLSAQIIKDAKVRTFAIARHYDLEREQDKSLRLTIHQQKLWIVVGGISTLLIITILLSVFAIKMHRNKEKQMRHEQEMEHLLYETERTRLEQERERQRLQTELTQVKLAQLHAELSTKSDFIHRILAERIELAKRINQLKPASNTSIPAWLQSYANRYSFADNNNWQSFLQEFDLAYGDFISYIHTHYPTLSESDIQYIILVTLGFDNNDISFVLERTDRTIWNRRNTIHKRIGNERISLDEWIIQLQNDYISSQSL